MQVVLLVDIETGANEPTDLVLEPTLSKRPFPRFRRVPQFLPSEPPGNQPERRAIGVNGGKYQKAVAMPKRCAAPPGARDTGRARNDCAGAVLTDRGQAVPYRSEASVVPPGASWLGDGRSADT